MGFNNIGFSFMQSPLIYNPYVQTFNGQKIAPGPSVFIVSEDFLHNISSENGIPITSEGG